MLHTVKKIPLLLHRFVGNANNRLYTSVHLLVVLYPDFAALFVRVNQGGLARDEKGHHFIEDVNNEFETKY
jgi:hypothetical protein